ncbi:MAG: insulinase family protein [Proteobacteria bacterium]|nr:insulinase family protein [Pseudomonadota bacterium]MBU4383569.1 insulinase family protein [Pseudomonadota bacterium]MBU4606426.1 insulinase family protein [Pseudomonadota bacterium]
MVNKTTLDNGVRLVTEKLPHAYSVTAGLWMEVGSRDEEPAQGGISHFIEHMAFKGTARRDALAIARELDRLGGMANAFTSKETTCFHARTLAEHLDTISDLLTDIFLHPAYDPTEVERERQVILQEISAVEDTPDDLVHVLFGQNYWPEHPMGRPVLGSSESVGALSRQDMVDYLAQRYAPANLVVAAVGQLEHQQIVDLLGASLAELPILSPREARQAPAANPGLVVVPRPCEQVHIAMGAPGPSSTDPDRFAAALLNVILGGNMSSRLFQEVREKRGLAYAVFSYLSSYSDSGVFGVYMGVAPGRSPEALKVVRAELARLAVEPVDEQELEHAKEHTKGSILLGAENPDSRMYRLARNEFNFGRDVTLEEVVAQIEAVQVGDLTRVAAKCLDPDKLGITVLGPADADGLAKEMAA